MKRQKTFSPSFTSVTPLSRLIALLLLLSLPVLAFFLGIEYQKAQSPVEFRLKYKEAQEAIRSKQGKVCTMDAKLCPDGSSVGRSGPNCEFLSCPQAN